MSAPAVLLAEAVKDVLAAHVFTPAIVPTREYQPFFELPAATVPKVSVYCQADDSTGKVDRSRWSHTLTIDVAVQQKLDTDANSEKDALVALADDICEWLKAHPPSRPEKLLTATVQPLWQNELLRQNKLFTSVVRLTFVSHR